MAWEPSSEMPIAPLMRQTGSHAVSAAAGPEHRPVDAWTRPLDRANIAEPPTGVPGQPPDTVPGQSRQRPLSAILPAG